MGEGTTTTERIIGTTPAKAEDGGTGEATAMARAKAKAGSTTKEEMEVEEGASLAAMDSRETGDGIAAKEKEGHEPNTPQTEANTEAATRATPTAEELAAGAQMVTGSKTRGTRTTPLGLRRGGAKIIRGGGMYDSYENDYYGQGNGNDGGGGRGWGR